MILINNNTHCLAVTRVNTYFPVIPNTATFVNNGNIGYLLLQNNWIKLPVYGCDSLMIIAFNNCT